MGEIIRSKILLNNQLLFRILLDIEEVMALKNAFRNVYVFSPVLCTNEARIIQRGRKNSSKYFEIPFNLRFRKKKIHDRICYQKLENFSEVFYIYVINKSPI